ncbi:hypothetical protein D3C73_1443760 [compost metagenome]
MLMCRSSAGRFSQASPSVAAPAMAARTTAGFAFPVRADRTRSESLKAMGSARRGGVANSSGSKSLTMANDSNPALNSTGPRTRLGRSRS